MQFSSVSSTVPFRPCSVIGQQSLETAQVSSLPSIFVIVARASLIATVQEAVATTHLVRFHDKPRAVMLEEVQHGNQSGRCPHYLDRGGIGM